MGNRDREPATKAPWDDVVPSVQALSAAGATSEQFSYVRKYPWLARHIVREMAIMSDAIASAFEDSTMNGVNSLVFLVGVASDPKIFYDLAIFAERADVRLLAAQKIEDPVLAARLVRQHGKNLEVVREVVRKIEDVPALRQLRRDVAHREDVAALIDEWIVSLLKQGT
jgi:hypothetical protein